jgi:RNA-directed DNA polymerase
VESPLLSFESPDQVRLALEAYAPLSESELAIYTTLTQNHLPPIVSAATLGVILGVNPKLLTAMAKFPQRYYREFEIPRKSGGVRIIRAPRTFLKTVQAYIRRYLLIPLGAPDCSTGFIQGRGIVFNATIHKGAVHLLNVDVENFFGSFTERSVREFFHGLGYSMEVARLLMGLCTYQGSLPQGAPTSPDLSNLLFASADDEIIHLCSRYKLKYSRYADDMTFSGPEAIPKQFLRDIQVILSKHGFRLKSQKTRFARPGQAKYVTGLVVNERVQAPRELRRKLRAMFHHAENAPNAFSDNALTLVGWASFVNSYDRRLGAKYLATARRVNTPR